MQGTKPREKYKNVIMAKHSSFLLYNIDWEKLLRIALKAVFLGAGMYSGHSIWNRGSQLKSCSIYEMRGLSRNSLKIWELIYQLSCGMCVGSLITERKGEASKMPTRIHNALEAGKESEALILTASFFSWGKNRHNIKCLNCHVSKCNGMFNVVKFYLFLQPQNCPYRLLKVKREAGYLSPILWLKTSFQQVNGEFGLYVIRSKNFEEPKSSEFWSWEAYYNPLSHFDWIKEMPKVAYF